MATTVQDIIDSITADVPGAPFDETVDTIKVGSADAEVTGVVTTFLATDRILHFAAEQGLNFVITHEPVFYNHTDETEPFAESLVLQAKLEFARENGITIWRCHDYAHSLEPDIIFEGVIGALQWEKYRVEADDVALFELTHRPRPTALANELKSALSTSRVLLAGAPDAQCRRVALLVGAPGGRHQLRAAIRHDVDALVCGEINEWETPEYFRDAAYGGAKKALLVVGHEPSEEAGMAALAKRLEARFNELPVMHRPAGDALRVI
ncbi:MAG: Nif3-like dinuclear metal center hexameric protein [Spirochaetota bacterium]